VTAVVDGGKGDDGERTKWGSGVVEEVKVERTSCVRARVGISPCPRGVAVETTDAPACHDSGCGLEQEGWEQLE
jgi:hypothetical protein